MFSLCVLSLILAVADYLGRVTCLTSVNLRQLDPKKLCIQDFALDNGSFKARFILPGPGKSHTVAFPSPHPEFSVI